MYTITNYQTKKALIEDFKKGIRIEVFPLGPFEGTSTGRVSLEGPHYPQPHKWYASAEIKNRVVIKVK